MGRGGVWEKKQQSSGSDSRKQFIHSVFPRPDSSYPEGWIYLFIIIIFFFFWVELVYKLQDRW